MPVSKTKVCRTCGRRKRVEDFPRYGNGHPTERRPYCRECYLAKQREMRAKSPNRSGVPRVPAPAEWILEKRCTLCGEVKPWADFPPQLYREDGAVSAVGSRCHACKAVMHREWLKNLPPDKWERRLAMKRRYGRKERAQIRKDRKRGRGEMLPAGPFVAFVRERLTEGWGQGHLAEHAGITERSLYRLLEGETQEVHIDIADRLAQATGYNLDRDMYGTREAA